ncbi:DEAD/DEAH box helicase [Ostertagia ostertagi]
MLLPKTFAVYDDIQEAEPLSLRPYQEELVETAVRGKNTIACAPTGSGKTEVAIYVAMSHLDEKAKSNQPARVAMLVPRTPLVDQQKYRFHKYVRGKYYVEGFHGSGLKGASRRDIVLACDIVVMTPQILLNMLKSIRQDERLYVCDFSLLIFDEVHHCTKVHPYNILMQTIHDYQGPKPQTMGLTASLGAGMPLTEDGGMEAIYELMANVGATALASIKRHVDILAQYVNKPDDFTKKVDRPQLQNSPFLSALITIMERIQHDVEPQLKKLTIDNETGYKLTKEEVRFEDPLVTEKYIQKLNTLATTLARIHNGDFKFEPSIALEYLSVLSQGVSINDLMPARYSLQYLYKNLTALKDKFEVECSAKFYKHFEKDQEKLKKSAKEEPKKPIVAVLEKELKDQFEKDENSRAIIFVTRRSTAVELMHYLNTDEVLGRKDLVGFVTSK